MREDWDIRLFKDVFDLQMGKTPDRKNFSLFEGDNTWVSIKDLDGKYISSSKECISDEAAKNIKLVKRGTVIMSFKLTIGKTAIAGKDLYTNEAIMAFNLRNGYDIDASFLYYYLKNYRWEGSNKAVMGITLNKATISKHKIAIPPKSTQLSIVSELDKLNELIQIKKEQLKDYDALAQSIFYEMFGDPVENEKGWEVKTFGDCFSIGAGGTPSTKVKEYWDNGTIPWIGSNMCQNCIITETDGKFITEEGLNHSSTKLLSPGTVLVALVGATIGKVGLLRIETCTNQNVAFIKVQEAETFTSEFVYYHLMGLYGEFMKIGKGNFKMANQGFIKLLPISCPPLSLQQSFAHKIEQIERQKAGVQKTITDLETLLAARMQYWFD